ncbi:MULTISPECIES: GNAT family N-acetyltransferase [Bacillus cereus group]|uniref:NADH dehydrogenase n=1 Tax=Bacillus thuringiensis subsp. higo TaxID=132266 RepID=A0A9X6LQE1_BACUH|nr:MULTISPECIES: GNAT family N-acetyltransferase [Bacillus cereus group]OJD95899.1 NADH dehydrogenase [Bacillus anthracis]OUB49563.1 NADH dehydrogenase [Bacillus thuringiensis serovar higo]
MDLETIFFKGLEFELLTKANYIRYIDQINKFGVGNDFAMSDYLQNDAYFNYITFKESVVLVFEDGNLVAYVTVRPELLEFEKDELNIFEEEEEETVFQTLEVLRIATDEKQQKRGIGTKVMDYISHVARISNIRYITLHAVSEKKYWYMERGFFSLSKEEIVTGFSYCYMYKDIAAENEELIVEYNEKRGNIV